MARGPLWAGAVTLLVVACNAAEGDDGDDWLEPDASGSSGSIDSAREAGAVDATTRGDAALDSSTDAGMPECSVVGVPGECLETNECAARDSHVSTAGSCEGPAAVQCCTAYGLALCDPDVWVSPNEGNTEEEPGVGGCPAGMLAVDEFCIDRFEASLVASDGSAWSPYRNPGDRVVRAVSVRGAVPQGYIDGARAAGACAMAGKRLCSDDEWRRACGGPTRTTYPYGDDVEPGRCNDRRALHPAVQYFGTSDPSIYSQLDNACLNQLPLSLERSGAREGCVTAEGAYDMVGNLHEWTSAPAGTFRGGFYVDTVQNGAGCNYATTAHDTHHWDYSTGFRCCADGPG